MISEHNVCTIYQIVLRTNSLVHGSAIYYRHSVIHVDNELTSLLGCKISLEFRDHF